MAYSAGSEKINYAPGKTGNILRDKHYRDLFRRHILRLFLMYILPLILVLFFFQYQYRDMLVESSGLHLKSIAENQGKLLDLFIRERLMNISTLFDDTYLQIPPSHEILDSYLAILKQESDAFIDIGFFDSCGVQVAYAGPLLSLEKKDYSSEEWFKELKKSEKKYIITDIYMGFRKKPHFTIAICRLVNDKYYVFRATLDPAKIYEYMTSLEGSSDVFISIVNKDGKFQLQSDEAAKIYRDSLFLPQANKTIGLDEAQSGEERIAYAFSRMKSADWAVIALNKNINEELSFWRIENSIMVISVGLIVILFFIIVIRAKKIVQFEMEKDITESQLEHAAKLASVGELAAGIAHEINNPLAIIASEAGLMRDMVNPEFNLKTKPEDMLPHLENIREAAFRGRDITRKLLAFVRQDEIKLARHDIHTIIDDVVDGIFGNEMAVSNIKLKKKYQPGIPVFLTDANQLKQVLVNIVKNAMDAIQGAGKITISTGYLDNNLTIAVNDTGMGMSKEQLSKIFLPFFTTKEVGKGTGLGLPVSYAIIKNFGGRLEVESIQGKGSTFTITIPLHL